MPSIRLANLVEQPDVKLHGDGGVATTGVASMQSTQTGSITLMVNPKYRRHLGVCQVSVVVMTQDGLPFAKSAVLIVKNPYLTYVCMAQILDAMPQPARDITPSAVIDATTKLGNDVSVGASAVTESGVELGNDAVIGAGCFVGKDTKIGAGPYLWANVTIYYNIQISENCLTQSSTVVGSGGSGYTNDRDNRVKIPQPGRVIIGDHVEIGACATIDRGTLDDTVIGNGIIIDNQCQIMHNVMIDNNTAVAGGVTMAGSLKIGRYHVIGGTSVINEYVEICDKVMVAGMGMVMRPITESGIYSSGIPLQPNKVWRRTAALVMNIDDTNEHLKAIEHKVDQQG